ncbi:glycosyltransferase family 1 protein [Corallincola holothuriorum]|uniref:Glycosyltransferase family 1 protein n=1 Tax=Corallincola holothuriorum TaxID=2282215 RepID=A0A368N7A2_9GAMM|nr:glycosyltransferase family 1 protein [Corallincola holothuriorum]RCU45149.1 glycosyltransferase family 1 protein [Corallincola holothuriorum]
MKESVAICVDDTGYGIQKDALILKNVLKDLGIDSIIFYKKNSNIQNYLPWRLRKFYFFTIAFICKVLAFFLKEKYTIMVHIQRINPLLAMRAKKNFLIPNQEWFSKSSVPLISLVDEVLTKSRYAEGIFKKIKCKTSYLGFTSGGPSRTSLLPLNQNPIRYLHRGGNSANRGTKTLINLWSKHPDWPPLTVLIGSHRLPDIAIPANVEIITKFLTEEEFAALMAAHPFHIHPTMVEGYGLTMSEGIAMGCVPIVTDAPPMNEIAKRDFSVLVKADKVGQQGLSDLFAVDTRALEDAIEKTTEMKENEVREMAQKGLTWHQENYKQFTHNVGTLFNCQTQSLYTESRR